MKKTARGDFSADQRLLQLSAISIVIGAVGAVVAVLLVKLIAWFTNLFFYLQFSLAPRSPAGSPLGVWMIVVPVIGGLIIGLMARYGSEKIRGHGIPEALEAILFGKSLMSLKVAILKPLSSAISIGSGGPFGAEGPIIMTGGAIGSLVAQRFHLSAAERKTLLVAGAAAGMSATFAAPIAAVLLAVELLLFEWKPRSLIPVALASAVAAALRVHLLGAGPLFPVPAHAIVAWPGLLAAVGVGLAAGAFSSLLSTLLYALEDGFEHLPLHWMWRPAVGGLFVGIGGYFQPRTLGVGYDVIGDLLLGRLAVSIILSLLLVKCGMWLISLASGTSGGVLAPLLIMGCGLGAVEALLLPSSGSVSLWPLVSMAAVLGGMMRAPFTAVIFALELTHDMESLPPLLIAAVIAYGFTVLVMKRSILTEKVARRGYDIFREYTVDPLETYRVSEAMTESVVSIPESFPAREIYERYFSTSQKHRGFPVVDSNEKLLGVLTMSDVMGMSLSGPEAALTARDLIRLDPIVAHPEETCREAAERMAESDIGRLPVLSGGKLIGIITRSDLLKPRLRRFEEERRSPV
ncbi:MAG TPA: chloride channel protein [Thermoanaerobaculia bacterium]|jgi:H+/Cl- antiporter ClcA/CBS domain-containing protein|nr:chloride channel protein [Thermoanaerobaculia bacterium]